MFHRRKIESQRGHQRLTLHALGMRGARGGRRARGQAAKESCGHRSTALRFKGLRELPGCGEEAGAEGGRQGNAP